MYSARRQVTDVRPLAARSNFSYLRCDLADMLIIVAPITKVLFEVRYVLYERTLTMLLKGVVDPAALRSALLTFSFNIV